MVLLAGYNIHVPQTGDSSDHATVAIPNMQARIAQLVRAPSLYLGGSRFES